MKRIGWGIIGYGVIGKHHAKAVTQAPGAELVAVCDTDPAREKVLREHGYKVPFYSNHREMLRKEPSLQAVSLCTPSGIHYQGARDAARSGRHVLSEKPLDISLDHMDRMIEGCERAGVKLACIFQKRTLPENVLAVKALKRKLIGKPLIGDSIQKYYRSPAYYRSAGWRGTWKWDGGGALMNQAVHGIDLLLWMMGEVESVFTYADRLARDIEVEDTALAVLRFKNGALGTVAGTTVAIPGQGCKTTIHGEKGTLVIGDGAIQCWSSRLVKGRHEHREVDLAKTFRVPGVAASKEGVASDPTALSTDGHTIQVQDFCNAILKDREPMVTGIEARRSVELILAMYRSWKTRKEVRLPL